MGPGVILENVNVNKDMLASIANLVGNNLNSKLKEYIVK